MFPVWILQVQFMSKCTLPKTSLPGSTQFPSISRQTFFSQLLTPYHSIFDHFSFIFCFLSYAWFCGCIPQRCPLSMVNLCCSHVLSILPFFRELSLSYLRWGYEAQVLPNPHSETSIWPGDIQGISSLWQCNSSEGSTYAASGVNKIPVSKFIINIYNQLYIINVYNYIWLIIYNFL